MTIIDKKANVFGILYTTKQMAMDIYNKSGRLADDNEYQVHYNMTNFRLADSMNFFIDISIPSVVFNYPQEVSSAAIAFEMTDVIAMAEKIEPVTEVKHKEILSKFYKPLLAFAQTNNFTLTVSKERYSNIHRHPGGLNSFSGTDYDKNPKNPGICFPLSTGKNTPIFSSIILHKTTAEITYSEYRVASTVDDVLTYYHGDCHTYCKGYSITLPAIYKFFTRKETKVASTSFPQPTLAVQQIYDIFEAVQYEPDTQLIQEANLSKKEPKFDKYGTSWNSFKKDCKPIVKSTPSYHIGKQPSFDTLIFNRPKYANSIFKTFHGEFLGADIIDAWEDLECTMETHYKELDFDSIEDFIMELEGLGLLDMYLEPYEKDDTLFKYKPKYINNYDDLKKV